MLRNAFTFLSPARTQLTAIEAHCVALYSKTDITGNDVLSYRLGLILFASARGHLFDTFEQGRRNRRESEEEKDGKTEPK